MNDEDSEMDMLSYFLDPDLEYSPISYGNVDLTQSDQEGTPPVSFQELSVQSETTFVQQEYSAPSSLQDPQPSATFDLQSSATFDPQPSATFDLQPSATFDLQPSATFDPQPSATFDPQPSATFDLQPSATFDLQPSATFDPQPSATFDPQPSENFDPHAAFPCFPHLPPLENEVGNQQTSGFYQRPPDQNIFFPCFSNAQSFGTLNNAQHQNFFSYNYENVLSGPALVFSQCYAPGLSRAIVNTKNGSELTYQGEQFQKRFYSVFLGQFDNKNVLKKEYVKKAFNFISEKVGCPPMTRDEIRCIKLFFNNRVSYENRILMCLRNNIKEIKDCINFSKLEKRIEEKKLNSKSRMKKNKA